MKIELSPSAKEWQKKARTYADEYLQPHEIEAELNNGVLPDDITERNKKRAIELGFSAIDAPKEYGGLELPMVEQGRHLGADGTCDQRLVLVFFRAAELDVRGLFSGADRGLRVADDAGRKERLLCHHGIRSRVGRRGHSRQPRTGMVTIMCLTARSGT